MCGIAGIVDMDNGFNTKALSTMSQILAHRGPDDEGFSVFSAQGLQHFSGTDSTTEISERLAPRVDQMVKGVGLVHRRLSILDLSAAGHQPMVSGNNVLAFNGEIYNYKELAAAFKHKEEALTSATDTEVILRSYAENGLNNVNDFRGMWAYALLDVHEQKLVLSRDRFGIKPLYYHQDGGRLIFASEIKAILAMEGISAEVSRSQLAQYISYGSLKKPYEVLFKGIKCVPPGHQLVLDLKAKDLAPKMVQYYTPEPKKSTSVSDYQQEFKQSIALHMRADVQVGSCLSGGLDSSAIVLEAASAVGGPFHTFTAGFEDPTIDESVYAKMLKKANSNLDQHFITPSAKGLMAQWDKMLYHQDLPVGSSSIFAQWEVMRCAHDEGLKVLLDGQGADEVLGGYYNFAGLKVIEALKRLDPIQAKREYNELKENFTPNMSSAVKRAAFGFLPQWLKFMVRKNNRLGPQLLSQNMRRALASTKAPARNGRSIKEHALKSLEHGMYELLRYEDRNSMAFSIESRVPFLDHRVVEAGLGLKSIELMKKGWTKWPIRDLLNGRLDDALVWRKDKKGFLTPQQAWKDELQEFMLAGVSTADPEIFDLPVLKSWLQRPALSNSQLSELWRVFSVIRWMTIFEVDVAQ